MSRTSDPPPVIRPAPRVKPRAAAARERSNRRRHRSDDVVVLVVAALAGVGTALASTLVVPVEPIALVLRAVLGFGVTVAGARARRWTWLVAGGVGVIASTDPWTLAAAGVAVGVAFVSIFLPRRRALGAVSIGFAVQALFRLPDLDGPMTATLVAFAALAPALGSAYLISPRRTRRLVRRVALGVGAFVLLAGVLAGIAALLGYGDATRGADKASDGMEQVRAGRTESAGPLLRDADDAFRSAESAFTGPLVWPAAVVPGLAQQVDSLAVLSRQGHEVAAAGAAVAEQVDYDALRYEDGAIDTSAITAVQDPLRTASATFADAKAAVDDQRGTALLPPLADAVARFGGELDDAAPQAAVAATTAELAPALLGSDEPRRYAVLFTTPAELRGLGGFVGSWAMLEAADGKVELVDSLRTAALNEQPGRDQRAITVPEDADPAERTAIEDYLNRYGVFRPEYYLQDVTFSPDLPTVGAVVEQLLPQAGQPAVDGVIVADPAGIASLLEITGPITVEGYDGRLDADTVEAFLLREQYEQFPERDARADFLGEVGRETFSQLVSGSLPSPRELGEVVAPAVRDGHLAMWSAERREAELLGSVGADGAFPATSGGDLLSVRTQNKGNNKIDVYMHRDVDQSVRFDPATGDVETVVRVRIRNDAPAEGLPDAVIGNNDQGLPFGTNAAFVSVYTPLGLQGALLDGDKTGMEFQRELGVSVYSRFVEIPPGDTVTLELRLAGRVASGDYRLTIAPQPTAEPDDYQLTVVPIDDWRVSEAGADDDLAVTIDDGGGRAVVTGAPNGVHRLLVEFTR